MTVPPSHRSVLMPLRAFIDSYLRSDLQNVDAFVQVLMPLRAFIDSYETYRLADEIRQASLNALAGIH